MCQKRLFCFLIHFAVTPWFGEGCVFDPPQKVYSVDVYLDGAQLLRTLLVNGNIL